MEHIQPNHKDNIPPGYSDPAYQDENDENELTDFDKGMINANDCYDHNRELER